MVAPFDIFKVAGRELRWLEAVETLQAAEARIKERALTSPGKFLIYDQRTGQGISLRSGREEVQSPPQAYNFESA
jgi:hypothetical protein